MMMRIVFHSILKNFKEFTGHSLIKAASYNHSKLKNRFASILRVFSKFGTCKLFIGRSNSCMRAIYNLLIKSCHFAPLCLRKTEESTVEPPIILYKFIVYMCTSPNLSSMTCSSTSCIAVSLPVSLFSPNFVYICDMISSVFLYLLVGACVTRLDDLFFCRADPASSMCWYRNKSLGRTDDLSWRGFSTRYN
jgi:hypothetical protein